MLLALGPHLLDTIVRTVVVGELDETARASIAAAAAGADALWLRSPTAEQVASAVRATGLPVGVTIDDVAALDALVDAGAVAFECDALAAIDVALDRQLTMWCSAAQADRALDAGVPVERVVGEPGGAAAVTAVGATVAGQGPGTWGEVVRRVHGGARVVRTTDVRSVRRVVTVTDQLLVARATATEGAAP